MSYAVMFVSLIAVNAQFMSMLTELRKALSLELKCLFMKQDYCSAIGMNSIKNYRCRSLRFFCITNKCIGGSRLLWGGFL